MFDHPPSTIGRNSPGNSDRDHQSLGQALRQLAVQPAPMDDWPRLRASLAQRRRARQRSAWRDYALAASLLLSIALALNLSPHSPPPTASPHSGPSLVDLQAESATLEAWLTQPGLSESQPPSLEAERISARQELLDRLQLIDSLLTEAVAKDAEHALWQQRVLLLRQLTLEFSSPASSAALAQHTPAILF